MVVVLNGTGFPELAGGERALCLRKAAPIPGGQALGQGLIPAGFSINADGGATYPAALVASETAKARPGDIILAHGNHPGSGTAAGVSAAVPALLEKGYSFTTLGAAFP